MNLDHDFVQVWKFSEDKKKVFIKNRTLFPQIQVKTKKKKIIGGDADVDHSQTIGGDTAELLGVIYPPLVSAPLTTGMNMSVERQRIAN